MAATTGNNTDSRCEVASLWRDSALHGTELLRACYRTFEFSPHFHETFAIGVTERGQQLYTSRRHPCVAMPPGTIAVVNPGEVHSSRAGDPEGWSYRMLYPDVGAVQGIADQVRGCRGGVPFFPDAVIHDPDLARRLCVLHRACEERDPCGLQRESWLLECLADLVARHGQERSVHDGPPPRFEHIEATRDLLDGCPTRVTLEELAALAGLSPFHFLRVFRRAMGLPPHAYLIQARVRRARDLLIRGATAGDAALAAGFADQSHLNRHFKRLTGVTPGAYARRAAAQ